VSAAIFGVVAVIASGTACTHATAPTAPSNKAPSGGVDDLALLPVDSEAVIAIHFDQLKSTNAWRELVAPQLAGAKVPSVIAKFKAVCGFDPIASLAFVSIGLKGLGTDDLGGAIVVHGFDRKQSLTCFDKDIGDAEKDGAKITIDGDVVRAVDSSGLNVGFTFVDDATAVVVIGAQAATTDSIRAIARGTGTLRSSPTFVQLHDQVDAGHSMWMIVNGNAPGIAKNFPFKTTALFGSINVTDGIAVAMTMRMVSADEASSTGGMFKSQIDSPMVKSLFDRIELTTAGADVKLAIAMSTAQLRSLVEQFLQAVTRD
jgi:hypothetical protein